MIRFERLACGTVFAMHLIVPVFGLGGTELEALDALVEMHELHDRTRPMDALTAKAREVLFALERPAR